jgi:hypothetical protein
MENRFPPSEVHHYDALIDWLRLSSIQSTSLWRAYWMMYCVGEQQQHPDLAFSHLATDPTFCWWLMFRFGWLLPGSIGWRGDYFQSGWAQGVCLMPAGTKRPLPGSMYHKWIMSIMRMDLFPCLACVTALWRMSTEVNVHGPVRTLNYCIPWVLWWPERYHYHMKWVKVSLE